MESISIDDLSDVATENALLRGLIDTNDEESIQTLTKLKAQYFSNDENRMIFEIIKELDNKRDNLSFTIVRAEVIKLDASLMKQLQSIAISEPIIVSFGADIVIEWYRKRELYKGLSLSISNLKASSSFKIANDTNKVLDEITLTNDDEFISYRDLKTKIENEPIVPKIRTQIPLIDTKMKGGLELGQLIGVMGDPEAGKTVLVTQILKSMSNQYETLFFNFEFHYRSFIEQNKINEDKFSLDRFLMESENNDILDIEAKIRIFARRKNARVVAIDSQMMITNSSNHGTSSERETEKFFILQRLAIRYGLIIFIIAQQGKEDTRSGTVSPMGSKNAAHALHQIWYIKKPKLQFTEDGDDEKKGERNFICYKNKQTGVHFNKPMKLDPRSLEFKGVQFDDEDTRSTKTVGSGRPKSSNAIPVEVYGADGILFETKTVYADD